MHKIVPARPRHTDYRMLSGDLFHNTVICFLPFLIFTFPVIYLPKNAPQNRYSNNTAKADGSYIEYCRQSHISLANIEPPLILPS